MQDAHIPHWLEKLGPQPGPSSMVERVRLRMIVAGCVLGGGAFGAFAVRQWLGGLPMLAAIDLAATLICFGNLAALRVHRRTALAGHIWVGLIFVALAALVIVSGGVGLPAPFLLCVLPIAATALIGSATAAVLWTTASIGVLAYTWGLHVTGHEFPGGVVVPTASLTFLSAISGVLITSMLAYFGVWTQNRAMLDLEDANRDLGRAETAAKAASAAKTRFLANMSHEIRTPMNGILGSLQLLDSSPDLPEEGHELSRTAMHSAHALLSLLDDIIDLAKVEADKMAFERVPYDVARIVREVVGLFAASGQDKGLEVSARVGEPGWVYGDPVRVRQVLTNLVGNAVKFTSEGFVRVELDQEPGPDGAPWLRIDVRDSGVGIPAAKQRQIFEAFEQADASTTRLHGGTGLGLAISKQLVDGMRGHLVVDSAPGRGTCFSVRLPLESAPAQPVSAPSARPIVSEARGTVLLVEDNRVNQLVASRMLERLGYTVETCEDGEAAVEAAARGGFVTILMDCHMPRMDGYEATRALRARQIRTPIIALTASAMQADRERCAAAGMDDFLAKPLEQEALSETLSRWSSRQGSDGRSASVAE